MRHTVDHFCLLGCHNDHHSNNATAPALSQKPGDMGDNGCHKTMSVTASTNARALEAIRALANAASITQTMTKARTVGKEKPAKAAYAPADIAPKAGPNNHRGANPSNPNTLLSPAPRPSPINATKPMCSPETTNTCTTPSC
ncbi:hypothetical protein GCM10007053_11520 [Halioglobus pacificus]|uniref:Uncharacterized protein n=1 Tax=Parahalioglobus pacificus TaxID=930806 RepID=A0A919CJ50_9GAMM|nr:hypothetical protein GCM10007053_11520 [Halioglobus pacificus]